MPICFRFGSLENINSLALCLYLVIQEDLRNIAKHSGAKAASITLQDLSNGVRLLIEDQGVGFEPEKVRKKAGIGLSSMRERVRLLEGAISLGKKLFATRVFPN